LLKPLGSRVIDVLPVATEVVPVHLPGVIEVTISKFKLVVVGSLSAMVLLGVGVGAGVAIADQPHMQNALNDLNAAQNQLQIAIPDKAGHRVNAINLVQQAISEVNLGIQAGQ
jgi:hypothetical protein